ncbi:hypothetical protein VTN31DRAFT_5766 [Thermomyces dupontii]|uniref:uncharacterized protein n=1 Tax=Talaromyces thermophilus TaxID=28565 RepID=UPI003741F42D
MSRTSVPAASSTFSIFTSFVQWLRLKNYQYEVTFALYMLTPVEKFIFNSLVLSLFTLFCLAAYIYLPDHVAAVYGHIHYYLTADVSHLKDHIPNASAMLSSSGETATSALRIVYETATKTSTATDLPTLAREL